MMDTWYDQQMPLKIDLDKAKLGDFKWKKMSGFKRNCGTFNDTLYHFKPRWRPVPKKAGLRVAETGGLRVAEKAGGKRKAPEPEAEKEKEPASEPEPFDPRPWQAKAISLINDPEADPNSIWWFYSPEEGTGKTDFENELLVNQYGALKIQFTSPRHTKALLGDFWNNTRQGKPLPPKTAEQQKQFDLWMQHKIICVDIARSDTATLNNSSTYVCMEDLQAGFMVSHYSPCAVSWKDAKGKSFRPKIVVCANDEPRHDKLSTNRLQVFSLDPDTFDLDKDLDFDRKLAKQKKTWADKGVSNRAAIAAIKAGMEEEEEPTVDVQTYFDQCYKLASAATGKIRAKEILETITRKGYRGGLRQMNAWIRNTYGPFEPHATEKDTKVSKTHPHVREKKPSNRVAFEGFVRV